MAADSQTIRFLLDGKIMQVIGEPATRTVLEYLRESLARTGTKEGCAEGDCGACTVVLGELAADGESISYRPVNACIRFLPTIDGKELITVESLRSHPVQRAVVEEHASQCGFCTPGFVMSLFALYLEQAAPSREQVVDALAGNLCRCTGYRPLIEAGCRMGSYPDPACWSRADARSAARVAALREIRRSRPLSFPGYRAPRTLDELSSALLAEPEALILAGGTDIGLWVTKHQRDLPSIIYIGDVAELNEISETAQGLRIGAAVPLSTAWPALVKAHPHLAEQARRFASPPIQGSATLCGNLANGSPIGDSIPALIALGARVELRKGHHSRSLPLELLYLDYQKKDLAPGEFVVAVTVPAQKPGQMFRSYKLAKRFDQDISAVCVAFAVTLRDGIVSDARLALGGMASTPKRAPAAEAALIGKPWTLESCEAAIRALAEDFEPITDLRASRAYRLQSAGNLLRRFYLEHSDDSAPVTLAAVEPVQAWLP